MGENAILLVPLLSLALLFGLQYLLCAKGSNRIVKNLPWLWVILAAGIAVLFRAADTTPEGAIDFMLVLAVLFGVYAVLCAAALLSARLVWRVRCAASLRKEAESAAQQPPPSA